MSAIAIREVRIDLHDADPETIVDHPSRWPGDNAQGLAPNTLFRPALFEGSTVAIVRVVELGDDVIAGAVVWSATYQNDDEARRRFAWLDADAKKSVQLGTVAALFGADEVTSEIEVGTEIERSRQEKAREHAAREAESLRLMEKHAAERAKVLSIHLLDRNRQFGLTIKRGGVAEPVWAIMFREKWERERFRDYFHWQRHRLQEFVDFLEINEPIELERMLLAEMVEAERAVKKAGKADRGRRPLRLWRGEEW